MAKKPDDARQPATADRGKGRVTRRAGRRVSAPAPGVPGPPSRPAGHPDRARPPQRRRASSICSSSWSSGCAATCSASRPTRTICSPTAATTCRPRSASTAALSLLGAQSFEHFIEIVTTDLAVLLDVDVVALCVETVDGETAKLRCRGVQLLPAGSVDRLLGPERAALLRDDTVGDRRDLRGRRRPGALRRAAAPQDRRRHARPACSRSARAIPAISIPARAPSCSTSWPASSSIASAHGSSCRGRHA